MDKYTWIDVGSSFLPSEMVAAFLLAQLENTDEILRRRLHCWDRYHEAFAEHEARGFIRRPQIPAHCEHNAHLYYLLLPNLTERSRFLTGMKSHEIGAVFHYIPLHSSPAGRRYGRTAGSMAVSDATSDRLVRMPLWLGMEEHQDRVIETALDLLPSWGRLGRAA